MGSAYPWAVYFDEYRQPTDRRKVRFIGAGGDFHDVPSIPPFRRYIPMPEA